ncbi:MAG: hypothetical protein Q4C96_01150 [Planctomycetia bacterium]|nr:hypothetical protein [Planctomycetia bacterium]
MQKPHEDYYHQILSILQNELHLVQKHDFFGQLILTVKIEHGVIQIAEIEKRDSKRVLRKSS